jgi:nucleoside-diphosphate-sugar epimerase
MKVFATGATGAMGRPAVLALIAAGHRVTALARSDHKAEWLRRQGATPVQVSLFERPSLAAAFRGHDAIVNLATALPATRDFHKMSAWAENIRIRTQGSATVVDAALEAGVTRIVQESVSMIYRDGADQWIDESWPVDDFPAAKSNLAAEASANRFIAAGGAGVILRFGWFYGPGATHSEELLSTARRWGICTALGAPETYVSSIHVADGGRAVEAALSVPAGTYNIVDDCPLTKREFAAALARAAGRRTYLRAPGRLALLLGDGMTSLTRSLRVSNARFKQAAGWRPEFPSAREGWQATAAMIAAEVDHSERTP